MTTPSELADELERMLAQFRSDLSSAHEEICKLQGLSPMDNAWPEWSPQANTLRWIDKSGPTILSALRRVEKMEAALEAFDAKNDDCPFSETQRRPADPRKDCPSCGAKPNQTCAKFVTASSVFVAAIRQALTGEA